VTRHWQWNDGGPAEKRALYWRMLRLVFPVLLLLSPGLLIGWMVPVYAGLPGLLIFLGSAAGVTCVILLARGVHRGLLWLAPFALPAALAAAYVIVFRFTPGEGLWLSLLNVNAAEFDSVMRMFALPALMALGATALYLVCLVGPSLSLRTWLPVPMLVALVLTALPFIFTAPLEATGAVRSGNSLWWKTFPFGLTADFARTAVRDMGASGREIPLPQVTRKAAEGREIYVLVVGEATRRDTWMGQLKDFPELAGPRNLIFTDAIAQAVYTKQSAPMLVTGITGPGHIGQPHWLHFAKATGCSPVWLTMNDIGTPYLGVAEFFDNWRVPHKQKLQYDTDLLPLLRAAIARHEKLCVLMHIEGAHDQYVDRYPSSFRPHPLSRDETVATTRPDRQALQKQAYTHAVAYSMHFVSQVITELERQNAYGLLVYAPDHGENLWDDGRNQILHGFGTRVEFEIPLHVWASRSFVAARPESWAMLQANTPRPVSNASILPTLLDAMGVDGQHRGSLLRPLPEEERTVSLESVVMPFRLLP
jgi:glucan phosphoethanolaminetransferase (alkaline phosphatase superfamily)